MHYSFKKFKSIGEIFPKLTGIDEESVATTFPKLELTNFQMNSCTEAIVCI